LLWREPLVWAAAESFELLPDAVLPLALYREHSVSRDAAIDVLQASERQWRIVYTSPSLSGVRAAALAGLAITPLPQSALGVGLKALGPNDGVPSLPDLQFAVFVRPRAGTAAAALAAALEELAPRRSLA
jgi:DNA-binding transcriptional LysR family regulator